MGRMTRDGAVEQEVKAKTPQRAIRHCAAAPVLLAPPPVLPLRATATQLTVAAAFRVSAPDPVSTSWNFASHAGCAGQAGAVTRLPSTTA